MKTHSIDHPPLSLVTIGRLVGAYSIDGLSLAFLNIVLTGWDTRGILWVLPDWPHRVCYVLAFVCYVVYFPLLQHGSTGRTIGERLLALPAHSLPFDRSKQRWYRVIGYVSKLVFVILVLLAVLWFLYVAFGLHYHNPADPNYCPWPCQQTHTPAPLFSLP
jgi:hypothetical protein